MGPTASFGLTTNEDGAASGQQIPLKRHGGDCYSGFTSHVLECSCGWNDALSTMISKEKMKAAVAVACVSCRKTHAKCSTWRPCDNCCETGDEVGASGPTLSAFVDRPVLFRIRVWT